LQQTHNLKLQFEKYFLRFDLEQTFEPLTFISTELPQTIQLCLQFFSRNMLLESGYQTFTLTAQLSDPQLLVLVFSSQTLNRSRGVSFEEKGSSGIGLSWKMEMFA